MAPPQALFLEPLYFPNEDPLVATLNAFGVYAVGFVARPIGAAIFGHFGDRVGRKSSLVATMMLMGVATWWAWCPLTPPSASGAQ